MLLGGITWQALPVIVPLSLIPRLCLRGPLLVRLWRESTAAAHPLAAVRSIRLAICTATHVVAESVLDTTRSTSAVHHAPRCSSGCNSASSHMDSLSLHAPSVEY